MVVVKREKDVIGDKSKICAYSNMSKKSVYSNMSKKSTQGNQ